MHTISERISALLKENNSTQKAMALATGIKPGTINAWLVRGSSIPAESIPAIATYLGVSSDYLLTGSADADADSTAGRRKMVQIYDSLQPIFRTQLISFGEGLAAAQSSIEGN